MSTPPADAGSTGADAPAGGGTPRRPALAAVGRTAAVVALCYLSALLAVNLSTSPSLSGFIARILPHIGAASSLDQASLAAEWQAIQDGYVIRDLPAGQGTQGAAQGMVQILHDSYGDRFTAYLTASQYQELTSSLGGVRQGSIGVAVEARCTGGVVCAAGQTPNEAVFEEVLVDQPAARAGVQRGDVLVAVNGTPLSSLASDEGTRIDRSASLVRGPVGTQVHLTVRRGNTTLTIAVTRENLQIPSVFTAMLGKVLYLQVTGFDTDTGSLARSRLQAGLAAGATSIVLDLRQNGGGYVSAAQALVSEFVAPSASRHDVVVRRGRLLPSGAPSSAQSVIHDTLQSGGVALTEPMVVLVDGDTASAAEITTAALRDYHRATVVGQTTFGKGSVQVDYPLPDGSDLHLTVERWYGPDGESIEGHGITPDRGVALSNPDARFEASALSPPASGDAQLQAALTLLGQ